MALSRASAPTSSAHPWKYDVFLSFRGEDTRKNFTDHLYEKLQLRAIKTFRDDLELERGKNISPDLLRAIEESRLAIIVLSANYASSAWCLDELSKILECMEARNAILPIFYDVDPSNVRNQMGTFLEVFNKHERNFREDLAKVQHWRAALSKVGNIAGWTSKDRYETELIKEIVEAVWNKVYPRFTWLCQTETLIGIDMALEQLDLLLDTEANDVRFIGIWSMGGMGKTTIARLVYETMSHNFEVSSFLANVREVSATQGLAHLQKQLLSTAYKEQFTEVWDVYSGTIMTKNCLFNKKVLLVLDDVDQLNQLETLAGKKDWFGLGSRIIITTRDQRLLVEHDVEKLYELMGLCRKEALQLFSWKAFRNDQPEEDYLALSMCFIRYAGGLPLALKTLGSFLYKRDRDAWNSALDSLKKIPNRTIFDTLKISYDGLDDIQKRVFLDVACFHKASYKYRVIQILNSCGYCGRIVMDVLAEKSLIGIKFDNVNVHDLIQEMAWEIVRRDSYDEPGRRSRLFLRKDIFHVLTKNTGTKTIEGIVLCMSTKLEEARWNPEAFSKMCKLKLVRFENLIISPGPRVLPNSLRFLEWSHYPSKSLPPSFQPDFLTVLHLRNSKIVQLWNGIKYSGSLKDIDLSYSKNLIRTPDFTGIPNLESLVLQGCISLVEIHPSIAVLKKLQVLDFENCKSIQSLPRKFEMECLIYFSLSGCSKVRRIPEFVGETKRLEDLYLDGTAIEEMPSSIERMIGLCILDITDCKSLLSLPNAIFSLKSLNMVYMSGCSKLGQLPENLGDLECFTDPENLGECEYQRENIEPPPPCFPANSIAVIYQKFISDSNSWRSWLPVGTLFRRNCPDAFGFGLI